MAKEIQEKRERRSEQAQYWPITSTVQSCVILDQTGAEVFSSSSGFGTQEGSISYAAMQVLTKQLATGKGAPVIPLALYDIGVSLFGLRIRDRMRIMALDALQYINQNPKNGTDDNYMIPFGIWNHRAFENGPWCDPYEALIPSEQRSDIPWDSLAEFLGIQVPAGDFDTDARLQADMARQITLKAGLVSSD